MEDICANYALQRVVQRQLSPHDVGPMPRQLQLIH